MADYEKERLKRLGRVRKKWRTDRGLTQPQVIEALAPYSLRAFQAWEAGHGNMKPGNLQKLGRLYGMRVAELRDDGNGEPGATPPSDLLRLETLEQRMDALAESPVADALRRLVQAAEELERRLRDQGPPPSGADDP